MITDPAVAPTAGSATAQHDTPLGPVTLIATDLGLASCLFARSKPSPTPSPTAVRPPQPAGTPEAAASPAAGRCLDQARRELDAYFAGTLREFTIPVDQRRVSQFDRTVLAGLAEVGYGATTTYGRLAGALGLPAAAVRNVGQALAHNPALMVVPCHRVVGADGALVGYAGGLAAKRWLIDHESDEPRLDLGL